MATVAQKLQQAISLHQSGQIEAAEGLYHQVLRAEPGHGATLHLLGLAALQRKKPRLAIQLIREAIAAVGESPSYYSDLGAAYRAENRMDEAADCYRRAIALDPRHADARFNLGILLKAQGELDEAARMYRSAIEIRPTHASAWINLGNLLIEQGQTDEALKVFKHCTGIAPQNADAWFNLANLHKSQGRLPQAIDCYERAYRLNPRNAGLLNNYANALLLLSRPAEAADLYEQALAIDPDYLDALHGLAIACESLQDDSRAEPLWRRLVQAAPERTEWSLRLGRALHRLGRLEETAKVFEDALRQNPDCVETHMQLGMIFVASRQLQEAEQCFRRVVALDPENGPGWLNLANVLKVRQDLDAAAAAYRRASSKMPQRSAALSELWIATLCPAIFQSNEEIDRYREKLRGDLERIAEMDMNLPLSAFGAEASVPPSNLQFQGRDNRPLLEQFASLFRDCFPEQRPPAGTGKPKIGFVVTAGHEGVFFRMMGRCLERMAVDDLEFTIVCPSISASILRRQLAGDHVRFLTIPQDFTGIVNAIRAARFDVLYHWENGTDVTNYFLPFCRLAPVQVTSGGNSQTTGNPAIDYFLSSDLQEPEDGHAHYTETLLRTRGLPSFQPRITPPASPRTRESFGFSTGQHLYCCAQKIQKIHPDFDVVLAEILRKDKRGVVALVEGKSPGTTDDLRRRFQRTLPDVLDRIRFFPRLNFEEYLELTRLADVILDPLHYGGGMTLYDAFSLDKPVVTCPSEFVRGRYTLGFYKHMGLSACVARDVLEYVRIAVALGTDVLFRRGVERELAEATPLIFEDHAVVEEYLRVFRRLAAEARQR